jgi:gas vesicle protein
MKLSAAIILVSALGAVGAVHAQQTAPRPGQEQRAAAREKWKDATPEQREAWKAQNPEAAKRVQEQRGAAREKWKNATPEQREAWKAQNPNAATRVLERRQSRQTVSP